VSGFGVFKSQSNIPSAVTHSLVPYEPETKIETISLPAMMSGAESRLNQRFSLSWEGGTFSKLVTVKTYEYLEKTELPWNLKLISHLYSYELSNPESYDKTKLLKLNIGYERGNGQFKQVYLYNTTKKTWQALPSTDYPNQDLVTGAISQTSGIVAVFAKPATLTVGRASWYKYKGGDFAASPDFPKGSRLRVTNLKNNKSVEVVVNDWGPDRQRHPERAIDLDREAFKKIGNLGDGVIDVVVNPIKIETDRNGRTLGVKADGLGSVPIMASKSVVVIDETDNSVLIEKNSQAVYPIASLTKVVAMSVYLSLKPDLNAYLVYKKADEEMNYRYCKPWESAKAVLKDNLKIKAKDLFNAALIGSANNAVESLVRQSGIGRDQFITKMNETVKAWGAQKTHFVEPTGLAKQNISSAQDYALIMKTAMTNDVIARASVAPSYDFVATDGKKHRYKNTNKLIIEQAQANLKAENFPIISSKTGYLAEAGYCLATRVRHANKNYAIVTLGAPSRESSFNEMADLINYIKYKIAKL